MTFPRSMRERLFLESASLSATSAKLPSSLFSSLVQESLMRLCTALATAALALMPLAVSAQRSLRDVSRATPDDERECERAEAGEVEQ